MSADAIRLPNPLLPGFNPDPSIVLVNGVYYLITSTFEYLPGIPVYRSTDLVEWTHVGNVATRPEQIGVERVPTPGGVFAPTIRYRDGVFYVIVSVMLGGRGCVVFTATHPAGPWSDGVEIPAVDGIDPDLAWDDDGTAYVTFAALGRGILQLTVDLETGRALEEPRRMWSGTGLYAPEGPHLYRRGEHWYLLIAEGGTDRGHAVSVARGDSPRGPFLGDPANPVLSARSTGSPVQNLGHADLFATPDGGGALVLLGVRPLGLAQRSPRWAGRRSSPASTGRTAGSGRDLMVELGPRNRNSDVALDFADPDTLSPTPAGSPPGACRPRSVHSRAHPGRLAIAGGACDLVTTCGHGSWGASSTTRRRCPPRRRLRRHRRSGIARHSESHFHRPAGLRGAGEVTELTARAPPPASSTPGQATLPAPGPGPPGPWSPRPAGWAPARRRRSDPAPGCVGGGRRSGTGGTGRPVLELRDRHVVDRPRRRDLRHRGAP